MRLEINALDHVMGRYGNMLEAVGEKAPLIMAMALNKEGNKGRTQIQRAIRDETGLKLKSVTRAIRTVYASPNTLSYMLVVKGTPIPLKDFDPREVRGGVKHKSKADPNPYPGGFLRVGGFVGKKGQRGRVFKMGARKATGRFGGHVLQNVEGGKWGGKVGKVMSKVRLDRAAVEGRSKAAFERIVPAVAEEVGRLLGTYLGGSMNVLTNAEKRASLSAAKRLRGG
ncbi:hypothetical protein ACD578_05325 [Microvirga sp. RSM25]|uniref:hypothetical protein n=1 Tax=Microvirga sp. RSM25 TaxID=3273802 RepID=UPI00384BCD4A